MTMKEDRESASFLSRAYQIAKLIAVTLASVVAFVISLIALDLSKGHWWVDIRLPLYGVTIIITAVVAVCAALCIWLALVVKDALDSRSFYRNESKSLRSMVSMLQDLAYNDSITGIPNSNKLREDMKVMTFDKPKKQKGEHLLIDDFDSTFYGEPDDEEIDLNKIKIHNKHSAAE